MTDLERLVGMPFAFLLRYVRAHWLSHGVVLAAVLGAVLCSVSTQYGVKFLVDSLGDDPSHAKGVWIAFAVLVTLIAADNLLWRLAGWTASHAFVAVTGDVRRDLFRHVSGHAPAFFADRQPAMLTGRITATSNAAYVIESMLAWNVLPPCIATLVAVAFVATVSLSMAAGLAVVSGLMVVLLFRLAARGRPLHHAFAERAGAVEGEMGDIVGNMPLVRAFGALRREQHRVGQALAGEMTARRHSLLYLERLRILHAVVTVTLTIGVLGWAILLWQQGRATTGDVVLACTLGLMVLHATRDLAVALVDVTQHVARLAEALGTLLVPHELRDHPQAAPLVRAGAKVTLEHVRFAYPDGYPVFGDLTLRLHPGERVGLVGPSGGGKSTLLALLQRSYDLHGGRILIDDQDITRVTQESLRAAIAVVPQDVSLFHRSVLENVRYGRPDASDVEVRAAVTAARCDDFIDRLPDGLETIVGARGTKLSGGQRQRIAIARAFLKDAPLLLLDEATSSLDSESEESIREALGRLVRGRTVIAIAHRLSTVRSFDRIVVLHSGAIVQDGPPERLLRSDGPYRELVRREMRRLDRAAA